MPEGDDPELKRLRWRCRRGMRELDVLLERYLAERWPSAPPARRAAFRALLELPDPELAALCLGPARGAVGTYSDLIAEITQPKSGELSPPTAVYSGDFGRTDRPEREP